jgi:hypothetical protein
MPAKPLPGSLEKPRRTSDLGFYWQKTHVLITGVELATGRGAPILFAPQDRVIEVHVERRRQHLRLEHSATGFGSARRYLMTLKTYWAIVCPGFCDFKINWQLRAARIVSEKDKRGVPFRGANVCD